MIWFIESHVSLTITSGDVNFSDGSTVSFCAYSTCVDCMEKELFSHSATFTVESIHSLMNCHVGELWPSELFRRIQGLEHRQRVLLKDLGENILIRAVTKRSHKVGYVLFIANELLEHDCITPVNRSVQVS